GRHLIVKEHLALDFGLKIVLNSVEATQIRSLDKASNGQKPLNSRNQGINASNIMELLFDPEQDVATAITGTSKDSIFNGSLISGRDSFSLNADTPVEDIHLLLAEAFRQYNSKTYKRDFAFIDDIRLIRDHEQVSRLNDELAFRLDNKLNFESCWLTTPRIIEWDFVSGFAFSLGMRAAMRPTLELHALLEQVKGKTQAVTIEGLKKQSIFALDANFNRLHSWKAYECLYAEIKIESSYYLLRNGSWFSVDNNFVERVNQSIAKIPRYEIALPDYDHESEGDYNEALAKSLNDSFCMDAKNIMHGGGKSRIEFCDVVIQETDLMHMKRCTSSSTLSHLFSQGVVSAESFKVDESFRRKLLMRLPKSANQAIYADKPREDEFRVVYAIVSNQDGELQLPFFSRVTLKNSVKRLESMGFRVAISKINTSKKVASTKKYQSEKKKAA
ncbi:MAG: TIGR04141 family sporadically distributed protein, partial [Thiothrix litoralis]